MECVYKCVRVCVCAWMFAISTYAENVNETKNVKCKFLLLALSMHGQSKYKTSNFNPLCLRSAPLNSQKL